MAEDKNIQETAQEAVQEGEVNEETREEVKETKASRKENKSRKEIEELQAKVAEAEEKAAKEHDTYIRLYAEFDNYRRRTAQEKLELVSVASKETIMGLLPILDDCERAMEVLSKSEDAQAAKEGTELIYNKLLGYLKSKGLAVIEARGEVFDTDVHEAVAQFPVPEEEKKGRVFDVVQTGYILNGKVIRFAKVVVGI